MSTPDLPIEVEAAIQELHKLGTGIAPLQETRIRELVALAVSHTQQAEREALARAFDETESDLWLAYEVRDYILSRSLSPAPDGSQEG